MLIDHKMAGGVRFARRLLWLALACSVLSIVRKIVSDPSQRSWHHLAMDGVSVLAFATVLSRGYGRTDRVLVDVVAVASTAVFVWALHDYRMAPRLAGSSAAGLGLAAFAAVIFVGLAGWTHVGGRIGRPAPQPG